VGRHKALAVLAAAAVPFIFAAWVQLVSVDQPGHVEPGTPFSVIVHGTASIWSEPIPLDKSYFMPPKEGSVALRLGVLVPASWGVERVTYQAGGSSGELASAPAEAATYEALRPAAAGYRWLAFGVSSAEVPEGAEVTYKLAVTPDARNGLYQLVYMTWADVPFRQASVVEAAVVVGQAGPPPHVVSFTPTDGAADVPLDTDIRITFDRDMDLESLRNGGVTLWAGPVWYVNGVPAWAEDVLVRPDWIPPLWPPYPVPISIFYNASTKSAVVEPLEPLTTDSIFTLTVDYRARAADGVPLDLARSATFLTVSGPDTPRFSDVPTDHRFHEAIESLAAAGIAHGYADGTFRPDEPITRADLAEMLVLLLGLHTQESGTPPPYSDVPVAAGDSTADFVREATDAGIVMGFPDGTFRPDETVTRIQLARMIVRASQTYLASPPPGYDAGFSDVDIPDLSFTNWAAYNHLVDGKAPGRFDPWSTATRGHAARILFGVWRLLSQPRPM
jgi:hypothetical protein